MIDTHKAIFLSIDDRILNLYKGYVQHGESLVDVKESDIYTDSYYYEQDYLISKTEKSFRVILIVPFLPILIPILILSELFKKSDVVNDKINFWIDGFFSLFFKKKRQAIRKIKNKQYSDAVEEDVLDFLTHCKNYLTKVYLYSYHQLTDEQKSKTEKLIQKSLISSCQIISKLSDLVPFVRSERISIWNSTLVISNLSEKQEAELLGFHSINGHKRNVQLWKKRKFAHDGGERELEWNSRETLREMKRDVEYYLKAKNTTFLLNDTVLFIEDAKDEFLNIYIERNLERINERLGKKKMQLLFFPAFRLSNTEALKPILEFIRYRLPTLYSLNDSELNSIIEAILEKSGPQEFYGMILEELELPVFPRPCLLRNIYGGKAENENKFTYQPIEYKTEQDLDDLFEKYVKLVRIPNDFEHIKYKLAPPPQEYDADLSFQGESKEETEELRAKIDSIKASGNYGVLAEAIMYMLETIKDEKPEIISKVRPLIEQRKLLESKTVLSPILVDKHCNIFLSDFGNIEVKMHALPKTVYLFFLRHPDGIRFKDLYQHKHELLEIYNKVTNRYERKEIEKAIDDLVDMRNPSINQKCARIREAFRKLMDEHIAKHYYIDGLNGQPKKVSLPQNLIDIRY